MVKYDKRKFDAYQVPGVESADFRDVKTIKKGSLWKYLLVAFCIIVVFVIVIWIL